jgi:hypothetical protein
MIEIYQLERNNMSTVEQTTQPDPLQNRKHLVRVQKNLERYRTEEAHRDQQKLQNHEKAAARKEREQRVYDYNVLVQTLINKKQENKLIKEKFRKERDQELHVARQAARKSRNGETTIALTQLANKNSKDYKNLCSKLKTEYKTLKLEVREKQAEISLIRTVIFPY